MMLPDLLAPLSMELPLEASRLIPKSMPNDRIRRFTPSVGEAEEADDLAEGFRRLIQATSRLSLFLVRLRGG